MASRNKSVKRLAADDELHRGFEENRSNWYKLHRKWRDKLDPQHSSGNR